MMRIILAILTLFSLSASEWNAEETLSQIEKTIQQKEKGAYLCFTHAEIEIAAGKSGDFWDQIGMQEILSLPFLKARQLLNDDLKLPLFSQFQGPWAAPIVSAFFSTLEKRRCIRFFNFLKKQNLIAIGEIPSETCEYLFGSQVRVFPNPEELPPLDSYSIVLLIDGGKHIAQRLLEENEALFVLDLSLMSEPLKSWDLNTWKKWTDRDVKIVFTSALNPYKFEERKEESIKTLKLLDNYGFKEKVYIAEAGPFIPTSYFDEYCSNVLYANVNDTTLVNQDVNEVKAVIATFRHFHFDDDDWVIKVAGKHQLNSEQFHNMVKADPEVDAYASPHPHRKVGMQTDCFAMRYKYYKRMIDEIDLEVMEDKLIDLERIFNEFLEKIRAEGAKVIIYPS